MKWGTSSDRLYFSVSWKQRFTGNKTRCEYSLKMKTVLQKAICAFLFHLWSNIPKDQIVRKDSFYLILFIAFEQWKVKKGCFRSLQIHTHSHLIYRSFFYFRLYFRLILFYPFCSLLPFHLTLDCSFRLTVIQL